MKLILHFLKPYRWICVFTILAMLLDVAGRVGNAVIVQPFFCFLACAAFWILDKCDHILFPLLFTHGGYW